MSKRKISKEKREQKREQQKRLAREERQRQNNALMRDMEVLAEQGTWNSEEAFRTVAMESLYQSAEWRNEREFADLAFEPFEAGHRTNQVLTEESLSPEELERLSPEEREGISFELHAEALEPLITPAFKREFFDRLGQFRQRLRAARDWDTLARVALVEMSLRQPSGEDSGVWPMCMLVYKMFTEALDEYARLAEAAEVALDTAQHTMGDVPLKEVLAVPRGTHPMEKELARAVEATPGLIDFLRRSGEAAVDEAEAALFMGELRLGLFTLEELDLLGRRFAAGFLSARVELDPTGPEWIGPKAKEQIAGLLYKAAAQLLDEIGTGQRRDVLYETARHRLEELACQRDSMGMHAATLLTVFDQETSPEDSSLFIRALLGEMHAMSKERARAAVSDQAGADAPEPGNG